jgi:hypothetical protein
MLENLGTIACQIFQYRTHRIGGHDITNVCVLSPVRDRGLVVSIAGNALHGVGNPPSIDVHRKALIGDCAELQALQERVAREGIAQHVLSAFALLALEAASHTVEMVKPLDPLESRPLEEDRTIELPLWLDWQQCRCLQVHHTGVLTGRQLPPHRIRPRKMIDREAVLFAADAGLDGNRTRLAFNDTGVDFNFQSAFGVDG